MTSEIVKDSVETLSNDLTRQLSSRTRGKVRKGVAASNATVPTIPSKYMTVITDNNERKGFQRTSKRFEYKFTDTPGPGSYTNAETTSITTNSPSHSRKGYGPFASSSSRTLRKLNQDATPAPGAYNPLGGSDHAHQNDSIYQQPSATFQRPIAVKREKENDQPAPNAYDVDKAVRWVHKQNNVCADHAFKSGSLRGGLPTSLDNVRVAPNSYFVKDDAVHSNTRVPYSSFKSSTRRHAFTPNSFVPAPNQYHPYEPITETVDRQLFPRRHYLAISAPAVPMTPDLPLPGPGAYNVRDFRDPDKKYMSSAVFVSSTGRWLNAAQNAPAIPGPANYYPAKITKQSFHYNYDKNGFNSHKYKRFIVCLFVVFNIYIIKLYL